MIDFKPMQEEHIKGFKYDGIELGAVSVLDIEDLLRYYKKSGDGYVGIIDGEVIGFAGVRLIWKGVGQTWMLMNQSAKPEIREIMEVIIGTFEEIVKVREYHRIQTFVIDGDRSSKKIAEMYGLTYESTMKSYGPNKEDYHIYAQVRS